MFSLLIEILVMFFMVTKEVIVAIFCAFIPPPEKSVDGEIVLVTGIVFILFDMISYQRQD